MDPNTTPRYTLLEVEKELGVLFFEREEEIRGLICALLCGEHVLLLGPPGAAKSELAQELCSRTSGAPYFRVQLTRTSTPEELFGPISLKALEQDSYRRKTTGMLPEAKVAFIDEVFKANSAVLNGLLSVLNERIYFNDGEARAVPLEMAVAASNELPASEAREELEALWDRFLLRYLVSYLKEERSFEALMLRNGARGGEDKTVLSEEALKKAREEAAVVDASGVVPQLLALRRELSEAGIVASDRRYKKCLSLLKAHAFLEGRKKATDDDLSVLAHALWSDPSQLRDVRKAVMERENPHLHRAQDLLDEASEVHKQAMNAPEEEQTNKGQEANAKLKGITNRLLSLRSEAEKEGRPPERIDEVLKAVATMNREVVARCLGITM